MFERGFQGDIVFDQFFSSGKSHNIAEIEKHYLFKLLFLANLVFDNYNCLT